MSTLGKEIRKARIDAGLNQKTLALAADVTQKYLSQIERDDAHPRFQIVARIARALHVSLDQFAQETAPHA